MKLSFRWYGEDDKVTLENIRQIPGMQSIVTAVYDVPVGEVWSREISSWASQPEINTLKIIAKISAALLKLVLNVSATTSCLYLTGQEPS